MSPPLRARRDDGRTLGAQQLGRRQADPAGRAGDEADAVGEAEIHRGRLA